MGDSEGGRYTAVADALRVCCDKKRLMASTAIALAGAQRAFDLAVQSPELASPWPEVAAYRLAHLMMRSPDRDKHLPRIESLFARAAWLSTQPESRLLGPLPAIYRLAVLHQMSLQPPGHGSTGAHAALNDAMEQARRAVWCWRSPDQDGCPSMPAQTGPLQIQDGCFNMLELASYFIGAEYGPLEGMGEREDFFPESDNGWWVLGPGAPGDAVLLSSAFAEEDLACRGRKRPGAALLVLSQRKSFWRTGGGMHRLPANEEETLLLAWLLKDPSIEREDLRFRVLGHQRVDHSEQTRFRQILRRAKTKLIELTGLPESRLFDQGDSVRIVADAPVFAAVHRPTMHRPSRSRIVTPASRGRL